MLRQPADKGLAGRYLRKLKGQQRLTGNTEEPTGRSPGFHDGEDLSLAAAGAGGGRRRRVRVGRHRPDVAFQFPNLRGDRLESRGAPAANVAETTVPRSGIKDVALPALRAENSREC